MKILFVVWNLYPNTAYTNHTKATVQGLIESGCKVDVLSIKPIVTKEEICIEGQHQGISMMATIWGFIMDFLLLAKSIKKYDVVFCACSDLQVMKLSLKKARRYHLPIVHERTEFPDFFYPDNKKGRKALSDYLRTVALFDKVFVISNPIRDYFIANGVPSEKVVIYPMVVDPGRFDGIVKKEVGYRYMAYCGNLSNSKDGVADLIEAYGRSEAKSTHKLMLIGAKPSSEEMSIYDGLIDKHNIKDRVIFRGQVNRDEMPQLLTDADALLLSRPANRQALGGFPTKLGEYLTTGNPVLVTRVGDIDKYITDGVNGFLSEPGNNEQFAQKLDEIVGDYAKAKKIGEKGRELVFDTFNYKVQAEKVLQAIRKLK